MSAIAAAIPSAHPSFEMKIISATDIPADGMSYLKRESFSGFKANPADLLIFKTYPLIVDIVRCDLIDWQKFKRLRDAAKSHVLDHLSGGYDREGKRF